MESVISVENLVKHFGTVRAVDGVSFEVKRGEVFGVLGPNGAGKTTTLEIIEGLQKPTAGRTLVLGIDTQREAGKVKEHIGVQLQASALNTSDIRHAWCDGRRTTFLGIPFGTYDTRSLGRGYIRIGVESIQV